MPVAGRIRVFVIFTRLFEKVFWVALGNQPTISKTDQMGDETHKSKDHSTLTVHQPTITFFLNHTTAHTHTTTLFFQQHHSTPAHYNTFFSTTLQCTGPPQHFFSTTLQCTGPPQHFFPNHATHTRSRYIQLLRTSILLIQCITF